MKKEDIDTFLKIVETKSLLQASNLLYISQSTASTRIKNLEEELHYPLMHRQKGIRQIVLTKQGEAFLPIARNMQSLFQEAMEIADQQFQISLSFGATDYLNMHLLYPFYEKMMKEHDIHLTIKTYHSREIYSKVDEGKLDLGLVYNLYQYPHIDEKKIYDEQIVLLARKDHPFFESRELKDLEEDEEIYCSYSKEFDQWKNRTFPTKDTITVGTLSNALQFLNPKRFLLIPDHMAKEYCRVHQEYDYGYLENSYHRTLYLIQSDYLKKNQQDIDFFQEKIIDFIQQSVK